MRSVAGWLAAVAALSTLPTGAQAQGDTLSIIAELRVRQAFTEVLPLLARDQAVLLPLRQVLRLLEIRVTDTALDGTTLAVLEPAGLVIGVRPSLRLAVRGDSTRTVAFGEVIWREDDLYVDAQVAAWILGVQVEMDWNELTLVLSATDHLPIVMRKARERRRAVALRRMNAPAELPNRWPAQSRPFSGIVLDWALTTATRSPFRSNVLQVGLGTTVAGGGLDVMHIAQQTATGWGHDTRTTWTRAWTDQAWVRQLRLGDVSGTGTRGRALRGFAVTNAPFLRLTTFGATVIEGSLPPGWGAELHRGDDMLAFAPVGDDGRYRLPAPITYGPNPLTVVAYGPDGRVQEQLLTIDVSFDRLPARTVEYGLSAGWCAEATICTHAGNADLRWGLSNRWTVRSGLDGFLRDSLDNLWHPYAGVSGAVTRAISVDAEAVWRGLVRAGARYIPSPDLALTARHTRFDTGVARPIVGSVERHRSDVSAFYRPPLFGGRAFLQATASHAVAPTLTTDLWRVGAIVRLLGSRLSGTMRGERYATAGDVTARTLAELGAETMLRTAWSWTRMMIVRGAVAVDLSAGRLDQLLAGTGRSLPFGGMRADLQGGWTRGRGGIVELTVSTALPALRAVARNSYDAASGVQGSQLFEGSMLLDPYAGAVSLGNGRSLGRAGANGIVFLDLNEDGRWQENEPGLPGVLVRVGPWAVATDTVGAFRVWDLVPFSGTPVEVDTLSLPNPLMVPGTVSAQLDAVPNSFRTIEIPFTLGGEVTGSVTRPGNRPANGLTLELIHPASGTRRTVRTFNDGTFYALGLRSGVWEVHPDSGTLQRLGYTAPATTFAVSSGGSTTVEITLISGSF